MIDPLFSLAISMHGAPGVFAILAGSGLSRSAGIKTGWEITQDLAGQVAASMLQDPGADAVDWFGKTFGREPGYSDLLAELSKSPAVRAQILQKYFEPTEDERAQGLKLPTAAHRAIAELASSGHIKLIVTTNFDRLIETALEERGISPVVISSPDAMVGAPPLDHSPCTVVKLHGDYRDARILNTPQELATYPEQVDVYLDRVFDEYGWIVVGWSAEWDAALRAAFDRSKSHRYPMFWASRHEPAGLAKEVITRRGADVIPITDADTFLPRLAERVSILAETPSAHPLSVTATVALAKRYLPEPRTRIRLFDLVSEETDSVFAELSKLPSNFTGEADVAPKVALAEGATERLAALLAAGTFHGEADHHRLWVRALERLANPPPGPPTVMNKGFDLRFLPALICMYAAGVGAVAAGQFKALRAVLLDPKVHGYDDDSPIADELFPEAILQRPLARLLPGRAQLKTPMSDQLADYLQRCLRDLLLGEDEYLDAFDRFELILGLVHADLNLHHKQPASWGPIGSFGWRTKYADRAWAEFTDQGAEWPPLKAGLLGGSATRLEAAREALRPGIMQLRF